MRTHRPKPHRILGRALGTVLLVALAGMAKAQDARVLAEANRSYAEVLQVLQSIVNTDSGNSNVKGIKLLSNLMINKLTETGAEIEVLPVESPYPGQNVIARWRGKGQRRIMMMGHMDTVFKEGTVEKRPFRIEGRRAYGPGVADCKGGIALALGAMQILQRIGFDDFAEITLVLNFDEEKGSLGSKDLLVEQGLKHDFALSIEAGSPEDAVVTSHKGIGYFKMTVEGKAAHAGVEPENGRNAVLELAHQVTQLSQIGRPDIGTTFNFTIFQGGERHNIIPDTAYAQADVRTYEANEFDRLDRDIAALVSQRRVPDTTIKWQLERRRPPFPKNNDTDTIATQLQAIYKEIGKSLVTKGTGGSGDINFVVAAGGAGIDSMGIVGGKLHTKDEYVELDSIVPRLYLLTRALMTVNL